MTMRIDFVDLKRQYLSIKADIDLAIQSVLDQSLFIDGPFVRSFEKNFAEAHDAAWCLGVNSGTAALHLALQALGIGRGDEVIVPSNTFFATAEVVSLCGATPVFVDCEPDYFNIDALAIARSITSKTKAIIPVHLYGQPADMDAIQAVAERHSCFLIEDCAQAHLAEYKGRKVGAFGAIGCFSFYPGKNLGAYGEGGAVITDDKALYSKMLALRNHGSLNKYKHDHIGHNYRMDGIQGAVLDVKLKRLSDWTQKRRAIAGAYRRLLKGIDELKLPLEMPGAQHVYHLFVVRADRRDDLRRYLEQKKISTGIHYPIPCHLQKPYRNRGRGDCPVSENISDQILSLPIYAELTEEEIGYICNIIRDFYSSAFRPDPTSSTAGDPNAEIPGKKNNGSKP